MIDVLMGNEAIALGLIEGGCSVISAYPGTPSSEILPFADKLRKRFNLNIFVEWSVNEKSAFELAYANSIIGGRSAVIMKQVGLNVAMDSLTSAAYIGVKGGMVVIVADDPGPYSSQTEQDTRFAGMFSKIPVLEPSCPNEARKFTKKALKLSEEVEIPIILRITGRIAHWRTDIKFSSINKNSFIKDVKFEKNPFRWAAIPKFRYLQHIELNKKLFKIANKKFFKYKKFDTNNNFLVITSGVCYSHIQEALRYLSLKKIDILKIDCPFPISKKIEKIINEYNNILILEESYPVIEYQLKKENIKGRLTGDVPLEGELSIDKIINILTKFVGKRKKIKQKDFPAKKPELCAGCPHRNSFYAMLKAFPKAIYPSDIGCYTLGLNMGAVDTCLCMGAAINQASGFYHGFKKQNKEIPPIIATIGDSTFYHSGTSALINSIYNKSGFVLVILDNSTTAMTGFQPTPETGILNDGKSNKIPIESLVKGCGVSFLKIISAYDIELLIKTIKEAWDYSQKKETVAVIISRAPCAILARKENNTNNFNLTINSKKCTGCKICVNKFQCPAIFYNKNTKKAEIDYSICIGCGVCTKICPEKAIEIC